MVVFDCLLKVFIMVEGLGLKVDGFWLMLENF